MINIKGNVFTLISHLTPAECELKLATAISLQPGIGVAGSAGKPRIRGDVTADSILLTVGTHGRNSFKTFAIARIAALKCGSRIQGTLSVHPAVQKVVQTWIVCSLMIGIPIILHLAASLSSFSTFRDFLTDPYLTEIRGLFFLGIMVPMYLIGRAASEGQGEMLKEFIVSTLEAHEEFIR